MPHTDTTIAVLFHVNHGCSGHIFPELGTIIEASDLISAKRKAIDLSPDWTTDIYLDRIDPLHVSEIRSGIEEAKAEARTASNFTS